MKPLTGILIVLSVWNLYAADPAPFDWTCPRPEGEPEKGIYFGVEERARLFPKPTYTPDFSHVDKARVHPAPPPGVHPRVYITPEDLPDIRQRIKTSKAAMTETSERWIQYWWGANGCSFEGMGKNQLNASHYIALARRGNWLICHPHVRRVIDSFYPSIMQPSGYAVTAHSGWGGSGNPLRLGDVLPMKWLAPDDPVVDFVYRNAVHDDYERIEPLDVVFAMDWTGPENWEEHSEAAGVPVNYVDRGRAMLCARSSWDTDATWLQFLCDQQWTAHMQMEIGNFLLTAYGKNWAQFIHANDSVGPSSYHSVLLIDGVQQHGLGRMVAVGQSESACFATADWSPAYNRYVTSPTEKPTYNDHHPLAPLKAPYADMKDDFSWRNGWLKVPAPGDWRADPIYEVDHAYRTIGMVRGPRPYVLVVDDVRKDDSGVPSQKRTATQRTTPRRNSLSFQFITVADGAWTVSRLRFAVGDTLRGGSMAGQEYSCK